MMSNRVENFNREKDPQIFNLSYLVLAVLILLTIGVTYNFFKSAKTKDAIRFNNQVNHLESSIKNRINLYVASLKGTKGYIETTPEITRSSFAKYVDRLDLESKDAGVQGIGFAKAVKREQRDALTKKMNAENHTDFRIFPESEKDIYQTIAYLEPMNEHNGRLVGFDMLTEESFAKVIELAKNSDDAAISGKLILAAEHNQKDQEEIIIFLPVYQKIDASASAQQNAADLSGFVFIAFNTNTFFNHIYQTLPEQDIGFKVFDNEINSQNLLAQTEGRNISALDFANITDEKHEAQNQLSIAGRIWILQYNTLPTFTEQSSVGWTPLILMCGFAFSFMLFGMTYWEASSRAQVEKTAAELFEMQKQREVLLDNERQARQTAEEANATKDEFISIISHELKTPLNAIAGWARILKTQELSRGTKELALQKIDKNLRSQASLVEQLLNYSEVISGKSVLKEERVDFSELFEEAFKQIQPLVKEKNIDISKYNQLDHHLIRGDKEKLKIVIDNILTNAVKFTQGSGKIEINVFESKSDIQMTVKDNGRGISPEFLPYIFERYKQADNPNIRDYGGLGLGLTISKHIVNLHRGKISAASEGKGKGATFSVTFPIDGQI
ncbi:MAG: CHASE domain-containing protein [Acidobacteriota bacterium]|nr:CHASE domain-containing protein [Acidobacteriota bacterium]